MDPLHLSLFSHNHRYSHNHNYNYRYSHNHSQNLIERIQSKHRHPLFRFLPDLPTFPLPSQLLILSLLFLLLILLPLLALLKTNPFALLLLLNFPLLPSLLPLIFRIIHSLSEKWILRELKKQL